MCGRKARGLEPVLGPPLREAICDMLRRPRQLRHRKWPCPASTTMMKNLNFNSLGENSPVLSHKQIREGHLDSWGASSNAAAIDRDFAPALGTVLASLGGWGGWLWGQSRRQAYSTGLGTNTKRSRVPVRWSLVSFAFVYPCTLGSQPKGSSAFVWPHAFPMLAWRH